MIKTTKTNIAIALGFAISLSLFIYGVGLFGTLFPKDTNIGDLDTLKVMICLLFGGIGCSILGFELYERHHDRTQEVFYHFNRNEGESK